MKAVITGGTGLVGQKLTTKLLNEGYRVSVFTRSGGGVSDRHSDLSFFRWPMDERGRSALRDADVVFNLAGAPVAQRWNKQARASILNSRVETTETVVSGLSQNCILVSASAIGIYSTGDEWLTEDAPAATGFLPQVVKQWEDAAMNAKNNGNRVVCARIGLVLSPDGGAMERLLPLFRFGLGSAVGNGKHWQSWIHIDDLVELLYFASVNGTMHGVYNAVAPKPVSNKVLSKALAKALKKPFFLPPVPGFILRLIFGAMSSIVLASHKVSSKRVETVGFNFQYREINGAMQALFGRTKL